MNKPTTTVIFFLITLFPLIGCQKVESSRDISTEAIADIPMSSERDSKFGVSYSILEFPGAAFLDKPKLNLMYIANNAYEVEGKATLETLSIVHDDNTLLASASINRKISMPPKEIVDAFFEVSLQIVDREKLASEVGKPVSERSSQYEVTWLLIHPLKSPVRRRVRF